MTEFVKITEEAGEEYGLAELFKRWKLPEQYHSKMSDRWRCRIAPTARSEEDVKGHVLDGCPVLVDPSYGKQACDQVGEDCLDFLVKDETRNKFPRPKIAFVAGWGRPGSRRMVFPMHEQACSVPRHHPGRRRGAEGGRVLRAGGEEEERPVRGSDDGWSGREDAGAPRIPKLPQALQWPLPELFGAGPTDKAA
eukprot:759600-Hanusia_phi.AAC.1